MNKQDVEICPLCGSIHSIAAEIIRQRKAVKAEREACALMAENFAKECGEPDGIMIAEKIRKRKTK